MAVFQRDPDTGRRIRSQRAIAGATWYMKFSIKGRRIYHAIPEARTRVEAESAETVTRASLLKDKYEIKDMGSMKFEDLVSSYLAAKALNESHDKDDWRSKRFLKEFGRPTPIGAIKTEDVRRLKDRLKREETRRGKPRSAADCNRHLALLRAMLRFAVKDGKLGTSPMGDGKAEFFKANHETPRFYSDDELKRLLDACSGEFAHLRPMLEFAVLTGCRTGEMLTLRWDDVDFGNSRIHFRNTKTSYDRFVAMGLRLRRLLHGVSKKEECEWVFPNPATGTPYGYYGAGKRLKPAFPRTPWEKIVAKAGVLDRRAIPYALRHTAATIIAREHSLHEAAAILGHSSLETTRIYAQVASEAYERAATVLEDRLERAIG